MTPSGLLISWATPAESRPIPASFSRLDEAVLVLAQRRGHRVPLPREGLELGRPAHLDARVELPGGDARRARLELRHGHRDGSADDERHDDGHPGRRHEQPHEDGERAPLDGIGVAAERADLRLEALDERLGEVLDSRHDELRAIVLELHAPSLAGEHGGDDPLAEDPVQPAALGLDPIDERALLRLLRGLAERAGEPQHGLARGPVEGQV